MAHAEDRYYIPHDSHWPVVGSAGLLFLMVGVSVWLNGANAGFWVMMTGVAIVVFMLIGWFGEVIRESVGGVYNAQVDMSFRMGMFWFIFSEVMFFSAFFGALFYARNMAVPWLGGDSNNFFTNLLLWDTYESTWPTNGPGNVGGEFEPMGPFGLPLINTAILLTSSVTVTIAHHALIHGQRNLLKIFLANWFTRICLRSNAIFPMKSSCRSMHCKITRPCSPAVQRSNPRRPGLMKRVPVIMRCCVLMLKQSVIPEQWAHVMTRVLV